MPRNFILTIPWGDKAPENPEDWLDSLDYGRITYICAQLEQGKKTGYRHLQCYIEVKDSYRISGLIKLIGVQAHVEPRRGTRLEAKAYCMKDDTRIGGPWERGTWHEAGQGRRSDLLAGCECVQEGGITSLIAEHPGLYVKYHRGFEKLHARLTVPVMGFRNVTVTVYWGHGGAGKTRRCWEEAGYDKLFPFPLQTKESIWCDGYDGQSAILLDDFDGSVMKYKAFLRFVDGYPLQVPVKGGFVWAQWTTVYITANAHPRNWWSRWTPELSRRITKIEHFGPPSICPEVGGNSVSPTSFETELASLLDSDSSDVE